MAKYVDIEPILKHCKKLVDDASDKLQRPGQSNNKYRQNFTALSEREKFWQILMDACTANVDQICHEIFDARDGGWDYLSSRSGISCYRCGCELKVYYCESRLYLVECDCCHTKALVRAASPEDAAYSTFAIPVQAIADMDAENTSLFFSHTPIDEPPVYLGSVCDENFPEGDVVCGMVIPCPGTDGGELEIQDQDDMEWEICRETDNRS